MLNNVLPVCITLIAAALLLTGYVMQVHGQSEKSQMITPVTAEILEEMAPVDGAIITNSFTLSLWISALTKAPTYTTWNAEPPAFFTEDDQRVRCVLGWRDWTFNVPNNVPNNLDARRGVNSQVSGQVGGHCNPIEAAEELGARWILIEEKFPWYFGEILGVPGVYGSLDYDDPWADLPNLPWLTLQYERGSTKVYRVRLLNTTRTPLAPPSR